ncbi:DUF2637 domain-containing protein [Amycolatopsis magusensis]|uniref:DUF2637 domain-containing protein n=1 Tax=Amycolatopsis magusensis TaxID=882444 RepID=UPI0024A99FD3|nr:DUF2637 domain-containing protein [Amycolatopsis magusensis]MDI5977984.1 DUF2637 domain-containing protein [Amycolatopsis magusensis]
MTLAPQSANGRTLAIAREALIAAPILIATLSAWWFQFEALRAAAQPVLLAAMVATALESLGLSMAGLAHKARTADDSPTLYRAGMWTIVLIAAAVNYRHGSADWTQPGLNGIVFAALSLGSATGWELRERQAHRQRHPDRLPPQRPRFGYARWIRFPRTTARATSLAIRDHITDPNTAWLAALAGLQQPHAPRQSHQSQNDLPPTTPDQPSTRPESEPEPPLAPPPAQEVNSIDVSDLLPVAQRVAAELGQRLSRDRLLDGIRAHGHSVGGRRRAAIYDAVRTDQA